ncbi:MAG: hypothetical protein V3U76_04030 [Granulosicoccus sp.]
MILQLRPDQAHLSGGVRIRASPVSGNITTSITIRGDANSPR